MPSKKFEVKVKSHSIEKKVEIKKVGEVTKVTDKLVLEDKDGKYKFTLTGPDGTFNGYREGDQMDIVVTGKQTTLSESLKKDAKEKQSREKHVKKVKARAAAKVKKTKKK